MRSKSVSSAQGKTLRPIYNLIREHERDSSEAAVEALSATIIEPLLDGSFSWPTFDDDFVLNYTQTTRLKLSTLKSFPKLVRRSLDAASSDATTFLALVSHALTLYGEATGDKKTTAQARSNLHEEAQQLVSSIKQAPIFWEEYSRKDASHFFKILLGRNPNSNDDMSARAARGMTDDLGRLLSSDEFRQNVINSIYFASTGVSKAPYVNEFRYLIEKKLWLGEEASAKLEDRESAISFLSEVVRDLKFGELANSVLSAKRRPNFEKLRDFCEGGFSAALSNFYEVEKNHWLVRCETTLEFGAEEAAPVFCGEQEVASLSRLRDDVFILKSTKPSFNINSIDSILMDGVHKNVFTIHTDNSANHNEALEKVEWYLTKGHFARALSLANKVTTSSPTYLEMQRARAYTLAHIGQFDEFLDIVEFFGLDYFAGGDAPNILASVMLFLKYSQDDQMLLSKGLSEIAISYDQLAALEQMSDPVKEVFWHVNVEGAPIKALAVLEALEEPEMFSVLADALMLPGRFESEEAFIRTLRYQSSIPLDKFLKFTKKTGLQVCDVKLLAHIGPVGDVDPKLVIRALDVISDDTGMNDAEIVSLTNIVIDSQELSPREKFLAARRLSRLGLKKEAAASFRKIKDQIWDYPDQVLQFAKAEYALLQLNGHTDAKYFEQVVDRASDLCQHHLLTSPKNDHWRHYLSEVLYLKEEFSHSLSILNDLIERHPEERKYRIDRLRVAEKATKPEYILEDVAYLNDEQEVDPRFVLKEVKAKRILDKAQEATADLEQYWHLDEELAVEYVRNYFYEARFTEARSAIEEVKKVHGDSPMLSLLHCATSYELGDYRDGLSDALSFARRGGDKIYPQDMAFLLYAFFHKLGREDEAIEQLDELFASLDCGPVRLASSSNLPTFDRLTGDILTTTEKVTNFPPVTNGPLVSVVMTAYNAEKHIETSVKSLLLQTYRNLEIIVVDDCSTDSTPAILKRLQQEHKNVHVILKSQNDGTYVSKNMGILRARGEFIALQDSDDWSHPDRIGKSVAVLLKKPNVMALTTDWIRMSTDGQIIVKAGGQIAHVCCISIVFRRAEVLNSIGLYDSVRIEADMEYIRRMRIVFGTENVLRLRWPLLFGRAHSESLTASEEYGITRTGFTEPRLNYQASYKKWHHKIKKGEIAALPFPMTKRVFEAPSVMLPERPR